MKNGCYSFNSPCLQSSGMQPCEAPQQQQGTCNLQDWFWWLAGITVVALLVHNGGSK